MEDAVEASIVPPGRPANPNVGSNTNLEEQQDSGETDPGYPQSDPFVQALLGEGFEILTTSSDGDRPTLVQRPAGTAIPILPESSPSASTDDTRDQADLFSSSATRTQTTCSGTTCTVNDRTDTAAQTLVNGTDLDNPAQRQALAIHLSGRRLRADTPHAVGSQQSGVGKGVRRQSGLQQVRLLRGAHPRRNEPQHKVRVWVQRGRRHRLGPQRHQLREGNWIG